VDDELSTGPAIQFNWETKISGTLFADDIIEINSVFSQNGISAEWNLSGDRELGEAQLSASSVTELIKNRLEVPHPRNIWANFNQDGQYLNKQSPATWGSVESEVREWLGPPHVRVAVGGRGASSRAVFDRMVRGIGEIKTRVEERTPRTSFQRNPASSERVIKLLRASQLALWALFVTYGLVAWAWLIVDADNGTWPAPLGILPIPLGLGFLVANRSQARIKKLVEWSEPASPLFDLSRESSSYKPSSPPDFMSKEMSYWLAGSALGIVLTVVTVVFTN